MSTKRLSLAPIAVAVAVITILMIGADRSHLAKAGGGVNAVTTCNSSSPCTEFDNGGTGAGIRGKSAGGNGIVGFTTFKSTSSDNSTAGVLGADLSSEDVFDAGVRGISVD